MFWVGMLGWALASAAEPTDGTTQRVVTAHVPMPTPLFWGANADAFYQKGWLQVARMEYVRSLPRGDSQHVWERLIDITDRVGGRWLLRESDVHIGPWNHLSEPTRSRVAYLAGLQAFERGDDNRAISDFAEVSESSVDAARAEYVSGVAHVRQGRLKSGVRAWTEVARNARASGANEIEALAELSIARRYYSVERFQDAADYIKLMPGGESTRPDAQSVLAWTKFMLKPGGPREIVEAAARLRGMTPPEFALLEAIERFNVAESGSGKHGYGNVAPVAVHFERTYAPIARALVAVGERAEAADALRDAVRAFARAGVVAEPWTAYFLSKFAADRDLADAEAVAAAIRSEADRYSRDPTYPTAEADAEARAADARARGLIVEHAAWELAYLREVGRQLTITLQECASFQDLLDHPASAP